MEIVAFDVCLCCEERDNTPEAYAVDPGTEPAVPGLTAAGQKDGNGNFVYRVSGTDTLVAIDGNGNQTAPYYPSDMTMTATGMTDDTVSNVKASKGGSLVTAERTANAVTGAALKFDLQTTEAVNALVESLKTTGKLPGNYSTKTEAMMNGWRPGKALNNTTPGGQLGGDVFANSTGVVPAAKGRIWYEADIGIDSTMSRAKQPGTRLLYSSDGELYITTDHYKTAAKIGNWK